MCRHAGFVVFQSASRTKGVVLQWGLWMMRLPRREETVVGDAFESKKCR